MAASLPGARPFPWRRGGTASRRHLSASCGKNRNPSVAKQGKPSPFSLENLPRIEHPPRPAGNDRGVAQLGRAPALGAGCRRFESCLPDHFPRKGTSENLLSGRCAGNFSESKAEKRPLSLDNGHFSNAGIWKFTKQMSGMRFSEVPARENHFPRVAGAG